MYISHMSQFSIIEMFDFWMLLKPLPTIEPTKSPGFWTFVDNCLDFDILTAYCLVAYQNRHSTITEAYKSQ